jgi:hypothetical protein
MTQKAGTIFGRALIAAAVLLMGVAVALSGEAQVKLTGSEETPPVTTTAAGVAAINVAADKSVSGTIRTTGIDGTMAHIHLGAPGQAGPPIITLTKSGEGVWSVPAGSKLSDEQYASYKDGNLYVNVHSDAHKAGEIRAQLKP